MKANTSKRISYYIQGQRQAARGLFILWLLASGSPEGVLAAPERQMVPATTAIPGAPSLASTPPTPLLEDQFPPDSSGASWGDSVASSPAIEASLQRQQPSNLLARARDRLSSRLWSPRGQEALRTPAGPVGEGITEVSRRATPSALQQLMSQRAVPKTKILLTALNAAPPQEQRPWVQAAIRWFATQPIEALTPAAIRDYAVLVHLQVTPGNRELLKRYFHSLYNKVEERSGDELLIQALSYVLAHLDPAIFAGDPTPLLDLGTNLLAKLNPSQRDFKQADYPSARASLEALFQTLSLAKEVAPKYLNVREGGLYQSFRNRLQEIIDRAQYYPVIYHARLIKQTLHLLEDPQIDFEGNLRRLGQGLQGMASLYQGGRGLFTLNLRVDKLVEGFHLLQQAAHGQRIDSRPWYDQLLILEGNMLYCLQQQDLSSYPAPGSLEQIVQNIRMSGFNLHRMFPGKVQQYQRALRFGIAMQLQILVLEGPTAEVRTGNIKRVIALSRPEAWGSDADVMSGLLDTLALVACQSHSSRSTEVAMAIGALEALSPELSVVTSGQSGMLGRLLRPHSPQDAASRAFSAWLVEETLPVKLQRLRDQTAERTPSDEERLFVQVRQFLLCPATPTLLPGGPSISPEETRRQLVSYYSGPDFPYVKSLFEGQLPRHVKDLECQLMLLEQKVVKQDKEGEEAREDHIAKHHERRYEWVKTRIGSEDLFKKRSIRPGDPEQEISRILLTGDPGTGKTTLSRQLAYQWSQGQWGQEFYTLYLLPVRSLQESEYDGTRYNRERTLSTAIVNTCFSHDLPATEDAYTSLRGHIDQELDKSTTLVILDGLDERAGASEEILRQSQVGTHKLLMLSRPYSIDAERRLAEIEIEHVGFNRDQLKAYVLSELSDGDQAVELLGYIGKHTNIQEISHVPVNLQILCSLWQDEDYGVKQAELEQGSLPGLYRLFMDFTWQRYTKRCGIEEENAEDLFDTLGKIGLEALSQGKAQINPGIVHQHAMQETSKAKLKDAGFLLLQYVGEDADRQRGFYEFPHLTFQEYFAGCTLAGKFLSKDEDEREEARKFISKHKYASQYGRTLSFMAGEVSRLSGVEGIKELLRLLGESDQELVGVQHLRLQLRVTHERLCMSGEDAEDDLAALEEEFQVLSSLKEWFGRGFGHVRLEGYAAGLPGFDLLGLLKSSLQSFGSVARHAPGLLELFKEAAEGPHGAVRLAAVSSLGGALAGAHDEARAMLKAMADDRHGSYEITNSARKALREAQGAESTQDEAAVVAQGSSGGAKEPASQSSEALLAQLRQAAKAAFFDNDEALSSARGSLVQAVAFATEEEFGALLDLLLPAAKDQDSLVRASAQEALLRAPLDALLGQYWSRPDFRLIPYIAPRLYHTPLVIAQSVRSGPQRVFLYAAAGQAREWRQPQGFLEDFERHVKDELSQLSDVESKLSGHIDKSLWEQYFGSVGEEPALPDDLEAILNSDCPFWGGLQVRDTHLLALIPSHVGGKPLTLDYLGELIKSPQEGYGTKYRDYDDYVRDSIGGQSPGRSYWVLMTRDVLEGSRNKSYQDQCALVSDHAKRTGISYEVPGALEAAVVTLLHHVRSGGRLYSDSPYTHTRCRESVVLDDEDWPVVVGAFSSGGLCVFNDIFGLSYSGVAGLRKF